MLNAFILAFSLLAARATPPIPYIDEGACPFECCAYGEWTALEEIAVYGARDATSKRKFSIRKGAKVQALTGAVVTTKPGRVEILEDMHLGAKLNVKRGDIVQILHYLGEGYVLFWYGGEVVEEELVAGVFLAKGAQPRMKVLEWATTVWWIRVRDAKGRTGWVNKAAFEGMGRCG